MNVSIVWVYVNIAVQCMTIWTMVGRLEHNHTALRGNRIALVVTLATNNKYMSKNTCLILATKNEL